MSNLQSLTKKKASASKARSFINQADKGREGERGKRLNVEIPEELHYQVKMKAAERGLSVRALVIQFLQSGVK